MLNQIYTPPSRSTKINPKHTLQLHTPALFIIVILMDRALTLPGVSQGLSFYLKPDFEKFTREGAPAAIGHSFFAIGVAMAVALVYGSYLPRGSKHVISNAVIDILQNGWP